MQPSHDHMIHDPQSCNNSTKDMAKRRGAVFIVLASFFLLGVIVSDVTFSRHQSGTFKDWFNEDDVRRTLKATTVAKDEAGNKTGTIVPIQIAKTDQPQRPGTTKKPRIAILSNFVTKQRTQDAPPMDSEFFPHLINKACYADYWGYDYFFNMRWGFPDHIRSRNDTSERLCFLDWGHWHRVPQLLELLDKKHGYDWILWADVDYLFADLAVPLETILADLDQHHLTNVQVIVPEDGHAKDSQFQFLFSSFAILIRNSDFGRKMLGNWMTYGQGLCPNGNFDRVGACKKYNWIHADQNGLWYALAKTYSDMTPSSENFTVQCGDNGHLQPHGFPRYGRHVGGYFQKQGLVVSSNYSEVPADQPIIWSKFAPYTRVGIGINSNALDKFRKEDSNYHGEGVFAMHLKKDLPASVRETNRNYCMVPHGGDCRVGYNTSDGQFDLTCHNHSFVLRESTTVLEGTLK
ncbi:expressed unknown protein [Seminavis robusta]|uniref:Nucleotide-diphospho-sugar transferase domain-containing protein n=1 Tax=Seminavis robusta TaxID=568900 RepID=A0A9N8H9A2_9STRA|nr:expressed unknown protein [Seminavis robusta]|eukprot:Sro248_g098240.1 n/a (462) ;mRNA; r:11400-12785